jgi:integrase
MNVALFRRNRTWWTDFSVNGARFRQSLETTDWREALAREKEKIAQASAGKLAPCAQKFARLAFTEAAERFLADKTPHLAPKSTRRQGDLLKPLKKFFASAKLSSLTAESIRSYISHRKQAGLSSTTINMEIAILGQLLRRAKRWHIVSDEIKRLPTSSGPGRALSLEEKIRLRKAASSRPEWEIARLAMTLALNTTMRGCELKGLRWRDVDFIEHTLDVRRATTKTDAGERVIPLNPEAWAAILELRQRIRTFYGAEPQPDWYVFPAGEGQGPRIGSNRTTVKPDPTRPMCGWRTAWRKLTRAAGLLGLRFHDLRHHAITELAEGQASDQVIRSIAGHVSQRMLEHYSHVRLDAKRKALEALSGKGLGGSYDTNYGTNSEPEQEPMPQLIEKNGGDDGTRTRDLCRDRAAF